MQSSSDCLGCLPFIKSMKTKSFRFGFAPKRKGKREPGARAFLIQEENELFRPSTRLIRSTALVSFPEKTSHRWNGTSTESHHCVCASEHCRVAFSKTVKMPTVLTRFQCFATRTTRPDTLRIISIRHRNIVGLPKKFISFRAQTVNYYSTGMMVGDVSAVEFKSVPNR